MKKLLVLVLGMFVVVACSDVDPNSGGGVTDGPTEETLNTSLITIEVDPAKKNLGTVPSGSDHQISVKFTNISSSETILRSAGVRNSSFNKGLDSITCDYTLDGNNIMTITLAAGASCGWIQNIRVRATTEGSPFAMYFVDANGDKLAVAIKYTIQ